MYNDAATLGLVLPDRWSSQSIAMLVGQTGFTAADVCSVICQHLEIAFYPDLSGMKPSALFVERIPIQLARTVGMIGLQESGDVMTVVLADPRDTEALDMVGRCLDIAVRPAGADAEHIRRLLDHSYQQQDSGAQQVIDGLDQPVGQVVWKSGDQDDLLVTEDKAPVVQLVNRLLFDAIKQQASDIHLQPMPGRVSVRFRIDGLLFDEYDIPRTSHEQMVSRVKVMGRMNIAEKRMAQDGRASVRLGDREIDLRISCIPTAHGERVVFRLLDKTSRLYSLGELGMREDQLACFRELIQTEHGLILVTGPTGSGKTTTLYSSLTALDSEHRNILTLEDPIEYQLPGISQMQVNQRKGMTFASGLRSVLRQDPDMIMVGEIRDRETAVMAIQSALTGHLVFSTLHTNDAAGAVTRLLDLGIESYLVAGSLVGVLAQRLVRLVCPHCSQPHRPTAQEIERLRIDATDLTDVTIRAAVGCSRCRQTGYVGRMGLFELLQVTESLRNKIVERAPASAIRREAVGEGMWTLRDAGLGLAYAGRTTVEEVLRVTIAGE